MEYCRIVAIVENEISDTRKRYIYMGANGGNDCHLDYQCDDFDPWAIYEWSTDIKDTKVLKIETAKKLLEIMRKRYPKTTLRWDLVPEDENGNPIKDAYDIFGYEEVPLSEEDLQIKRNNRIAFLRIRREDAGLTQRQLAEKSGVSYSLICKYESGEKDINKAKIETLLKLTTAMKCSIQDILTDERLIELFDNSFCN